MKNILKKCSAAFVASTVALSSFPYSAMAWEDETMKKLAEVSLMSGQKTDNVEQNEPLTRAEFMALVNRMMGFTKESDDVKKYQDIAADAWYYHDVAKALEAQYIYGTDQDKMSPLDQITNQEMYAILTRITAKEEGEIQLKDVPDQTDIASWAKQGIEQAILNGYVLADADFKLNPTKQTTKADAITLLENLKNEDRVFYYPGKYHITEARNVKILANDVSIKNAVIKGDLTLGAEVHSVDLGNAKVTGSIIKENEKVEIAGDLVWNDGIFIGVAQGENGPIKINVEIADGKIKNISILEHKEKPEALEKIQKLLKKVVKAGTFEGIEIGNDKTINSEGFLNAVKDAIAQSTKITAKPGESEAAQKYKNLKDGTYEGISNGYGGKLRVEIEIKDGKLVDLKVVEHSETSSYFDAVQRVIKQIIEKGGVDGVDTLSGATISSKAIINAVKDAMSQAVGLTEEAGETEAAAEVMESSSKGKKPTQPQGNEYQEGSLLDGEYQGKAIGYGGPIVVTVTIQSGKIANVRVDSHKETPSYYERAKVILKDIVRENSTKVDTISNATSTSKGLLAAVENALSIKQEKMEYADGTWYGQGRGYNTYDHIDTTSGQSIFKTATEAAVTVEEGKITKVELVYYGDDEGYKPKDEAYDLIEDHIVEHQGLGKLLEIFATQDRKDPIFDAVSGATNGARGYANAINDALSRSAKFKKDGVSQEIRSLRLLYDTIPKEIYYEFPVDFSNVQMEITYLDQQRKETVALKDAEKYGIKCSVPMEYIPKPDNNDYSEEKNFELKIEDPNSTSKTVYNCQANRKKVKKQPIRIDYKLKALDKQFSVPLKDAFNYEVALTDAEFQTLKKAIDPYGDPADSLDALKVIELDLDQNEVETPLKSVELFPTETEIQLILQIQQVKRPLPTDPVKTEYAYEFIYIHMVNKEKFNPDRIEKIEVTKQPNKTTYDKNEKLDLTGLEITATDFNGIKKVIPLENFSEYGITDIYPENGNTLYNAGEIQVYIRHVNYSLNRLQTTFMITVRETDPPVEEAATETMEPVVPENQENEHKAEVEAPDASQTVPEADDKTPDQEEETKQEEGKNDAQASTEDAVNPEETEKSESAEEPVQSQETSTEHTDQSEGTAGTEPTEQKEATL